MFSDCLLMFFLVLWQWWTSTDAVTCLKLLIKTPGVVNIAALSKYLLAEKYLMLLTVAGIQVAGG